MNEQIKLDILNKIKEYDRIVISRHIRPDGDAVGSTNGLYTILRDTFP
ncbi:MAG: bifunctional oligoribonuclease/PAP phosphatase NrnA, partial [Clostridia bacterium]|nr:bifunctional oligoribonuclease/PAP phosphatase NrnA [Clostridia bacterium]